MKRRLYLPLLIMALASLVSGVLPLGQPVAVYAASIATAALYPTAVATTDTNMNGGNPLDIDWLTPTNVFADDGAYAEILTNAYDSPAYSFRLDATNFGFSIPAGSTIDGIVVEIDKMGAKAADSLVQMIQGGTPTGTNNSVGTAHLATETIETYGSSIDLWGLTWTVADIEANDFGVAYAAQSTGNNGESRVDFIRITIYYTPVAPSILNTPTSWALGAVDSSSTYDTGIDYVLDTSGFRLTNNSAFPVNIAISASNMTDVQGGTPWTLADNPAGDAYALKAGTTDTGTYDVTVTSGGTILKSGLAGGNTSIDWGLQLLTPTSFSDYYLKSGTVTLTATQV